MLNCKKLELNWELRELDSNEKYIEKMYTPLALSIWLIRYSINGCNDNWFDWMDVRIDWS